MHNPKICRHAKRGRYHRTVRFLEAYNECYMNGGKMIEWNDVKKEMPEPFQKILMKKESPKGDIMIFSGWLQPDQGGTPLNWMLWGGIVQEGITHWAVLNYPKK